MHSGASSSADNASGASYRSDTGFVAALLLTVIGGSTFNIMPLLTAAAEDTLGFSDSQVGIMSLSNTVGSGLSALFAVTWVRSVRWRHAGVVALLGALLSNIGSMVFHQFWLFVLFQGLAGVFAAGLICLAMTILSDRKESARAFGIANALQVVYQIAGFVAGPRLLLVGGLNAILAVIVGLSVLGLFLVPLLPTSGRAVLVERVSGNLLKPTTLLGLLGFGAFFVSAGAYWTYVQIMAEAVGMPSQLASKCVAAGVSAGILGGAAAWALGDRFGKLRPVLVSAVLAVGSGLLLYGAFGTAAFIASVVLYFIAWNCSVAYQLSIVNAGDDTGRAIAVTQACAFLGAAMGAGLAALFVSPGHYQGVIWLLVINVCVSTMLFVAAMRILSRQGAGKSGLV
jgi:predicted MFS family arabinose efflux permease